MVPKLLHYHTIRDGGCELVKGVIQGKVHGKQHHKMDGWKYGRNHAGLEGWRYMEKIGARCSTGG